MFNKVIYTIYNKTHSEVDYSPFSRLFSLFPFTCKERDEETGYGYFGARYMDHELMTMWLSVDPMADKYPSISSYNYCMWNPIKVIDPDGMDTLVFNKYGNYSHTIQTEGEHIGRYDQPSGTPYVFHFADPVNDPISIENGEITKFCLGLKKVDFFSKSFFQCLTLKKVDTIVKKNEKFRS